jgi:hypothetical protein
MKKKVKGKTKKKCDFPDGIDFHKKYVISFLWEDVVKETKKTGISCSLMVYNKKKNTTRTVYSTVPKPVEEKEMVATGISRIAP